MVLGRETREPRGEERDYARTALWPWLKTRPQGQHESKRAHLPRSPRGAGHLCVGADLHLGMWLLGKSSALGRALGSSILTPRYSYTLLQGHKHQLLDKTPHILGHVSRSIMLIVYRKKGQRLECGAVFVPCSVTSVLTWRPHTTDCQCLVCAESHNSQSMFQNWTCHLTGPLGASSSSSPIRPVSEGAFGFPSLSHAPLSFTEFCLVSFLFHYRFSVTGCALSALLQPPLQGPGGWALAPGKSPSKPDPAWTRVPNSTLGVAGKLRKVSRT